MKGRCSNPTNDSYARYGGRGICVCEEWRRDYVTFRAWAHSHGYQEGLTLDRIDPDKDYEPSNCRWLTRSENSGYAVTYRVEQVDRLKARVRELTKELDIADRARSMSGR